MRPLALVVIALLLAGLHAQAIDNPQMASSASIVVNESGTVLVAGGGMKNLWLRVPVPIDSEYQQVSSDLPYRLDPDGNPYVEINVSRPPNPFLYSMASTVKSVWRTTGSLPETSVMGEGELKYLAATNRTQSDDAEIVALAANITAGSEDDFEKVARLAIWVNRNVAYNQNYLGRREDAVSVLHQRQGVCFEYATLFAALARADGIPTRYVIGNVYSNMFNTWLGHAWDEVYLGKWVPVDPTWFEVGSLDALHVEAAKYMETLREDDLRADIYPANAKLEWETNGRSGAVAANIAALEVGIAAPESNFTLAAAESKIAPGGTTLVYLEMEGEDYRVVPATLAACTGAGALQVEGGTQYLILRPGRKAAAAWKVTAPPNIPADYYYTCPLTLNSPYLEERVLEINVDPRVKALPEYEASLQEQNPSAGSQDAVLLALPPARQGREYYAITEWGISALNVSSSTALLPFYVYGQGNRWVYVAGSGGGYYELPYEPVPVANGGIGIDWVGIPDALVAGKEAHAIVNVSAKSYPQKVSVEMDEGGKKLVQSGMLASQGSFKFDFTPENEGPLQISFGATAEGGASAEKSAFANVLPQPEVKLSSASFAKKGETYESVLEFEGSGNPIGIIADVDGQQRPVVDGRAVFWLSEGAHSLKISWLDGAGNEYEHSEPLQAKPAGLFGSQAPSGTGQSAGAGICPVAFFAILLVVPALLFKR